MRTVHEGWWVRLYGSLIVTAFWALLLYGCVQEDPRPAPASELDP